MTRIRWGKSSINEPYKGGRKKPDPIEEAGPSLNATGMMTGRQGSTVPGREVALSASRRRPVMRLPEIVA